jgi:hypothetical protein
MLREMLTKHGIDFLTSAKGGWVTASVSLVYPLHE